MKILLCSLLLVFCCGRSFAQYYYKDILGTEETKQMMQVYQKNKVSRVHLTSYDESNTRNEDFYVEQEFSPARLELKTVTRSGVSDESIMFTYINANGQVIKTVDSTGIISSITAYRYNTDGSLAGTLNTSKDTSNTSTLEEHIWQYENGKPARMFRVKNKIDTTFVLLKQDDKGNISEEVTLHKGLKSEPVYYYYDARNRLTDIVRFNNKAKRLLPEYMFEYADNNQVIQKITVPANGSNYLIWRYQYDTNGLKTKEVVFNRYKQKTGSVEYQYQY